MKIMLLYPYEYEFSALTLQARLLEKGLKELSHEVVCMYCGFEFSKRIEYDNFKPDVVIGVGFWGDTPRLIMEPMKKGFMAVPWFNADGWVANYHSFLDNLPLILVTSDWVRQTYIRDGVKGDNIYVAHVGVDSDLFKPLPKNDEKVLKIREMLGISPDEKMILTVGGDVTSKGAQEMFKALAKINEKFKNWKYICKSWPSANTGNWHKEELKLIEGLGIKDKVIFHDEIIQHDYMPYLLNACELYAAPSRLEGFGMLQVEAMSCGKPVISINAMGPRETIVHGKTGFLADVAEEVKLKSEWANEGMGFSEKKIIEFEKPKTFAYKANVKQLEEYTLKLLENDELRDKIGKQAREHVLNNFDYKISAKRIVELITKHLIEGG